MRYFKLTIFLFALGALQISCTEDFQELNTRPDALIASKVDAGLLGQAFAKAQYAAMHGEHWRFQISENLFSDLYCQYFATTATNFDSDRYVEVGRWIDLAWSSFYGEAAPQIKFVEDLSAASNLTLANAISKVWKVQAYHRQTDYWGPIIYSQYGNGETTVGYDTQEAIYKSFFTTLDEAVSVLKANSSGNAFGANDQIYAGSAAAWLKFANSLRLRLAMRVKYVDAALSKAQAEKAVADGVMTSNADNAWIKTTANSLNPFTTITDWGEFRMSALMESTLKGYADPRMSKYFDPAVSGDSDGDGNPFEGLRNGQAKVDKVSALNLDNSDMNVRYLPQGKGGANPPMKVMTAAEIFFLRAEGALEGYNMGGTAKDFYEQGIRASMAELNAASGAAVDAYIASTAIPVPTGDKFNTQPSTNIPVAYDASGTKERQLEQIITQKWIGLYPDGWEAFAEVRRTGYPKLIPILNSENVDLKSTDIFRRMTFVDSEFSSNKAAVDAASALPEVSSRGGDKNNTRVWWDAKK